jgi:hypothetical protein
VLLSNYQIEGDDVGETVACMRNSCRVLFCLFVCLPERMTPLRRCRCRWEDNIKVDVGEIGLEVVGCIYLVQGRNQWAFL